MCSWSAAASRSASTTTSVPLSNASGSRSGSGVSPCAPGGPRGSASCRRAGSSSGCQATRCRRSSPSCCSYVPRSSPRRGAIPPRRPRPPCWTSATRSVPVAPTRSAWGWRQARTAGTPASPRIRAPTSSPRCSAPTASRSSPRSQATSRPASASGSSSCRTSIWPMTVRVRLFAALRERAGRGEIQLVLDDGATVADAMSELERRPELAEALDRISVRIAVNRDYAAPETALHAGDELALVPPVSGGEDVHVRVGSEPISLDALSRMVLRPSAGAVVTFQGTPRNVAALDYEAYVEMSEERIAAILRECVERHGLAAAAAEHRVGPVPLGDASVLVAVSAPHRAEAFAGAREAIDRIKEEAPIWKRVVEGRA